MCVALTKITLRKNQNKISVKSNALWAQDGEKLLEEGNTDLKRTKRNFKNEC